MMSDTILVVATCVTAIATAIICVVTGRQVMLFRRQLSMSTAPDVSVAVVSTPDGNIGIQFKNVGSRDAFNIRLSEHEVVPSHFDADKRFRLPGGGKEIGCLPPGQSALFMIGCFTNDGPVPKSFSVRSTVRFTDSPDGGKDFQKPILLASDWLDKHDWRTAETAHLMKIEQAIESLTSEL
ncbi:MAG: hypothetical protein F6K17_38590 [Okeania sp. SIO3C4]|nr:hypothetical protein [Okeania sp. SIO3C4]